MQTSWAVIRAPFLELGLKRVESSCDMLSSVSSVGCRGVTLQKNTLVSSVSVLCLRVPSGGVSSVTDVTLIALVDTSQYGDCDLTFTSSRDHFEDNAFAVPQMAMCRCISQLTFQLSEAYRLLIMFEEFPVISEPGEGGF